MIFFKELEESTLFLISESAHGISQIGEKLNNMCKNIEMSDIYM